MSQITKLRNLPSALSEEVLTNFEFYRSISGKTHNSGPYSLKECYFKAATESSIWGIIESEQISTFLADGVSVAITVKAAIILAGIGLAECIFTLGRSRTIYTNFRLYVDTCGTESKNYSYLFFAFNFITVSTIVSFVIIAPISTVKYFFARHLPQEQNIVFDKLYEATLALDERWFAFIQLVLDFMSTNHFIEQQSAKQFYTNTCLREAKKALRRYANINKEFAHEKNENRLLSPLGSAIFNGRTEIVKFLIQSGANITSKEIELAKTLVALENKNIENERICAYIEKICTYIEKNIFNTIKLPIIFMSHGVLSKNNNVELQDDEAEKLKNFTLNVTNSMDVLQDVLAYI